LRFTLFRATSAICGVLAACVLLELALRVHAAFDPIPEQALALAARMQPPAFRRDCKQQSLQASGLTELVRPSADPDIVYELKPNIDTCWLGVRISTNADAVRAARRYARPKPAGTWRVLLLGDSQTFGAGVDLDDTWGARVERELAALAPATAVEVVNAGVPGYNTAQEAAHFLRHGHSYEPDCVIVLAIGNDFNLPHLMFSPRDPFDLTTSYLWSSLTSLRDRRNAANGQSWFEVADEVPRLEEEAAARVPTHYRHMVGVAGYQRAQRALAVATRARGIPLVVFADYHKRGALAAALRRHEQVLGILHPDYEYPGSPKYWLSAEDAHLNPSGNAELARRVLAGLRATEVCLPPEARTQNTSAP